MLAVKFLTGFYLAVAMAVAAHAGEPPVGDSAPSGEPRARPSAADRVDSAKRRIGDPSGLTGGQSSSIQSPPTDEHAKFTTESIRGRVVWMGDVLQRRYGIQLTPDARQRTLALETPDGRIYPLVEDLRGRSFRTDKRLRDMDVELLVRRYEGSPMIQIVRVHEVREDGKYIVDYWCDVCAIEMYEKGPCACCQEQNRLRKRRIE